MDYKVDNINYKIVKWFEEGNIINAVLGDRPFFISDVTFREKHDRLLIFTQLLIWTTKKKNEVKVAKIIEKMIIELCASNRINEVIDIIWCLLLSQDDLTINLPINMLVIEAELIALVKKNSSKISRQEELRSVVIALSDKLPEFKKGINL